MKKIAALAMFSFAAFAAEWTGAISESGCGAKHANGGGEKCVSACVKKGAAPVFVVNGEVKKISNADKVMSHLGKKVKITGTLSGDTVTVDTIADAQ